MARLASGPSVRGAKVVPPRSVIARGSAVSATTPVPDMTKRTIMNGLLLGAVALPVAGLAVPYLAFFVPPGYDHHAAKGSCDCGELYGVVRGTALMAEGAPRDRRAISLAMLSQYRTVTRRRKTNVQFALYAFA
jgi:hypothetical protein